MRATDRWLAATLLSAAGCPGADHLLGGLSDGGMESSGDDASSDDSGADTTAASDTGDATDPFADAEPIKTYAEGLTLATGGVWSPMRNRLLVADQGADAILEVRPLSFATIVSPAGEPAAIAERGDALVTAESATGDIVQRDDVGLQVIVDGLARPVAIAIEADEDVWIVDAVAEDDAVIGRLALDGEWTVELAGIGAARGLALAADESALFVATDIGVSRIAIADDGALAAADAIAQIDDATPAICVDDDGHVLVGSGTSMVALGAAGEVVGTLAVGEIVLDCSFGGYDRRTLLLATSTAILSVRLTVAGPP